MQYVFIVAQINAFMTFNIINNTSYIKSGFYSLDQRCFMKYDHLKAHIIFTGNLRLFTAQGKTNRRYIAAFDNPWICNSCSHIFYKHARQLQSNIQLV